MSAAADTIAAIATAAGAGGIGVIRISGPRAEVCARRVVPAFPLGVDSHRMVLGQARAEDGELLDQVLVVIMRAPRSYTGEDVAELHAHGGAFNLKRLLEAVLRAGARVAAPGEFTRRAFLAGRLDLAEAEAVADVIAAESERALRVAQAQLAGRLGERVRAWRAELIALLAEVEGRIDFPEEGLEEIPSAELVERARAIADEARVLAASYRQGRVLREGLEVALVGAPNAGKSSLLNRLAGRERAVVSADPGTTRDFVEARVVWGGIAVTLVDTPGERAEGAGLGSVERHGMVLARERTREVDVRVRVVDGEAAERGLASSEGGGPGDVVVWNKVDRMSGSAPTGALAVSALTGEGIEALVAAVLCAAGMAGTHEREATVVTSARQAALLEATSVAAAEGAEGAARGVSEELIAADLRAALAASGELLGEGAPDEVLDAVFARFCIGK